MKGLYYLLLTVLINILLLLHVRRVINAHLGNIKKEKDSLEKSYNELTKKDKQTREKNFNLSQRLEAIIEIYEVTKDICKSLEADEVFAIFKEKLKGYIYIEDCQFIKDQFNQAAFKDYLILPLNIDSKVAGYLAVRGIKQEELEKFNILSAQFFMGLKRAMLYQQIQELAITDSLTMVFTRRYFMDKLNEEIERSTKFDMKFAFLMADIDHFKEYNDRYGHLVGDVVLKETAATIKESVRQIDVIGRYGGEEFVILLPETTPHNAYFAAERIRKAIAAKRIKAYDEELSLTISIGVANFPKDAKDSPELIDKADMALYQAKDKGRNQVFAFTIK